eukprot:scaffold49877_cov66-Phaeocystis_antarctica.AAC.2
MPCTMFTSACPHMPMLRTCICSRSFATVVIAARGYTTFSSLRERRSSPWKPSTFRLNHHSWISYCSSPTSDLPAAKPSRARPWSSRMRSAGAVTLARVPSATPPAGTTGKLSGPSSPPASDLGRSHSSVSITSS